MIRKKNGGALSRSRRERESLVRKISRCQDFLRGSSKSSNVRDPRRARVKCGLGLEPFAPGWYGKHSNGSYSSVCAVPLPGSQPDRPASLLRARHPISAARNCGNSKRGHNARVEGAFLFFLFLYRESGGARCWRAARPRQSHRISRRGPGSSSSFDSTFSPRESHRAGTAGPSLSYLGQRGLRDEPLGEIPWVARRQSHCHDYRIRNTLARCPLCLAGAREPLLGCCPTMPLLRAREFGEFGAGEPLDGILPRLRGASSSSSSD